ncbi:MAG: polyprenyl synthetase family protein [Methanosarcinales archaeon]|nr:polyprenyl synthetase family protein [Methanosarcinales archaeon]
MNTIRDWDEYTRINEAITDFVNGINPTSKLKSITDHVCNSSGKKIRPIALLLTTRLGGCDAEHAVDAALAIELIHTASLIHDDILDEGVMRRGIETAHKRYGHALAMLCGDYLISKSIELISSYDHAVIKDFGVMGMTMAEGEAMDIQQFDFADAEYFDCIRNKTASLFATSAVLGGRIAGFGAKDISDLHRFGECVGMTYQIVDDLSEVYDMHQNKCSAKPTAALENACNQKELLNKGIDAARGYLEQARSIIDNYDDCDAKTKLLDITNLMVMDTDTSTHDMLALNR